MILGYSGDFDVLYVKFCRTNVPGRDVDSNCTIFEKDGKVQGMYIYGYKRLLANEPERIRGYEKIIGVSLAKTA